MCVKYLSPINKGKNVLLWIIDRVNEKINLLISAKEFDRYITIIP